MSLPQTITSANSKFTLVVAALGLGPYTLQGYSADTAFAADPVDIAETQMGVDGNMSAGYTPYISPIQITMQADSPSIPEFIDPWAGGMKIAREVAFANAVIDIPGNGKSYICTKGVLKRLTPLPPHGKVQGSCVYTIDFQDIQPVPLVA